MDKQTKGLQNIIESPLGAGTRMGKLRGIVSRQDKKGKLRHKIKQRAVRIFLTRSHNSPLPLPLPLLPNMIVQFWTSGDFCATFPLSMIDLIYSNTVRFQKKNNRY